MTTPNTEPIPATDSKIERHKHCHSSCDGSERCVCGHDLSGVTHYALIARIEQEREMRRELQNVLLELVAWGIDHDGACPEDDTCDCPRVMRVNSALARAAKMEEDNAK